MCRRCRNHPESWRLRGMSEGGFYGSDPRRRRIKPQYTACLDPSIRETLITARGFESKHNIVVYFIFIASAATLRVGDSRPFVCCQSGKSCVQYWLISNIYSVPYYRLSLSTHCLSSGYVVCIRVTRVRNSHYIVVYIQRTPHAGFGQISLICTNEYCTIIFVIHGCQ